MNMNIHSGRMCMHVCVRESGCKRKVYIKVFSLQSIPSLKNVALNYPFYTNYIETYMVNSFISLF